MSTPTSQHLLLLRGTTWYEELSPQEIQEIMDQTTTWFQSLNDRGLFLGGQPLEQIGRVITNGTRLAADGPFIEAKESVGGYVLLAVSSLDEAVAIAQACPMLPYGLTIEVRPVAAECAMQRFVNERQVAAAV